MCDQDGRGTRLTTPWTIGGQALVIMQFLCVDDTSSPSAWTMPPVRVRGRCRREVSVEKDAYDADFIGVYGVRNDVVAAASGIMAELEQRRIANVVRGRNSPIALAGLLTT